MSPCLSPCVDDWDNVVLTSTELRKLSNQQVRKKKRTRKRERTMKIKNKEEKE